MRTRGKASFIGVSARMVVIALLCGFTVGAGATNPFKTLFAFNGRNGLSPTGTLVADAEGNLYGTTNNGGTLYDGVVFELTPMAQGQWKETILHSFTGGSDGAYPWAGVIFDSKGNIYGTTFEGGGSSNCEFGCGIVFQLTEGQAAPGRSAFSTDLPARPTAPSPMGLPLTRREISTAQQGAVNRIIASWVAAVSSS